MKTQYMAFNGISRRPMVMGVPFVAFILTGAIGLVFTVLFAAIAGPVGLFFFSVPCAILFFLRELCVTDNYAPEMLYVEMLWFLRAFCANRGKLSGGYLAIRPIKFGRLL
jgi:type IV secretion system protein VirB3